MPFTQLIGSSFCIVAAIEIAIGPSKRDSSSNPDLHQPEIERASARRESKRRGHPWGSVPARRGPPRAENRREDQGSSER